MVKESKYIKDKNGDTFIFIPTVSEGRVIHHALGLSAMLAYFVQLAKNKIKTTELE